MRWQRRVWLCAPVTATLLLLGACSGAPAQLPDAAPGRAGPAPAACAPSVASQGSPPFASGLVLGQDGLVAQPSAPAPEKLEVVSHQTVGDTTCQSDADCVLTAQAQSNCACCPSAPSATSKAWLSWYLADLARRRSVESCPSCERAQCAKTVTPDSYWAVCRQHSCELARSKASH